MKKRRKLLGLYKFSYLSTYFSGINAAAAAAAATMSLIGRFVTKHSS